MSILMLLIAGQADAAHVGSDMCEEPSDATTDKALGDNASNIDNGSAIDPTSDVSEVCTA
jgi:hypothetical protein